MHIAELEFHRWNVLYFLFFFCRLLLSSSRFNSILIQRLFLYLYQSNYCTIFFLFLFYFICSSSEFSIFWCKLFNPTCVKNVVKILSDRRLTKRFGSTILRIKFETMFFIGFQPIESVFVSFPFKIFIKLLSNRHYCSH